MKQLPQDTVRLLSSSQVVTSVLSVVKELTENSLDAHATSLTINLENFGLDRIEVRDNGSGVSEEDAPHMGLRFFTSKISCTSDLETLQSYGFRGEALGSICAVAQVSVVTKSKDEEVARSFSLDQEGNISRQRPAHLEQGTSVCVQRLFQNLPVRKHLYSNMKRRRDELRRITELLQSFAIVKPELRVTLYHNKVLLWQKSKMADLRSALVATLGIKVVSNLQPFHQRLHCPQMVLEGFLPRPDADLTWSSSSGPDKSFIFINERPVQLRDISKLFRQHFLSLHSDEARGRFPTFVLKVSVSASTVDVNLTPDKTQVLLHDQEALLTAVEDLLVSVYGNQTSAQTQTKEEEPGPKPPDRSSESTVDLPEDDSTPQSPDVCSGNSSRTNQIEKTSKTLSGEPSLHCQASNGSSSSSIADDWILNHLPANFSLCDDGSKSQIAENPDRNPPGKNLDSETISAEAWSRGTALRETVSDKPLQPTSILCPTSVLCPTSNTAAKTSSTITEKTFNTTEKTSNTITKKISNAAEKSSKGFTEKRSTVILEKTSSPVLERRAALTAFDVLAERSVRSPVALFEKEVRADVVLQNPGAGLQQIDATVRERWSTLSHDERQRFEERAQRLQERQERSRTPRRGLSLGQKRKAPPLSNQQLLDQLFSNNQPQKKICKASGTIHQQKKICRASETIRCSLTPLRQNLLRLSSSSTLASSSSTPVPLCRLASQGCWVLLEAQRLLVMNPLRAEEVLLFQKLMENNMVPAVDLKDPVLLTTEIVGGEDNMAALWTMEKQNPELDGSVVFSDLRLVANSFRITITSDRQQLQLRAVAECVPFLGPGDLKEILSTVVQKKKSKVSECRPLKVYNYLKGEAVRLVRQMSSHLSRDEVKEVLRRMEAQLEPNHRRCLHDRPFTQLLCELPSSEQEARARARPLNL